MRFFTLTIVLFFLTCPLRGQSLPSEDVWWQAFRDPLLMQLLDGAATHNYNMLNAIRNIDISRSQLRIARGAYYPSLSLSGYYAPEKNSEGIEHVDTRYYTGAATLSSSWEIDLFGKIRKSVRSQKQLYYATQENARSVAVALYAEVAANYISLRASQGLLDVAIRNSASQEKIMKLTEEMFNSGLASALDYAQARSLYLQTIATIPGLESSITIQANALAVLTGTLNDSVVNELEKARPMPIFPTTQTLEIPATLIRRRPDVRESELQMESLAAEVGVEKSNWFPQFLVTGSFGFGSEKFSHFFDSENMDWKIAPTLSWTLFNGRETTESVRIARLKWEEGVNNYNNIVLTAMQEARNAQVAYNKGLEQLFAEQSALQQIRETLAFATKLYEQGLTDYQNVLDMQQSVYSYENNFISAQSDVLTYLIQLYKALGGTWTPIGN